MTDFGDLRALLQRPPSQATWEELCAWLSARAERGGEARRQLDQDWSRHVTSSLERWPDDLRVAPQRWLDAADEVVLRHARDPAARFVREAVSPFAGSGGSTWEDRGDVGVPTRLPAARVLERMSFHHSPALSLSAARDVPRVCSTDWDGRWVVWDDGLIEAMGQIPSEVGVRLRESALSPDGSLLAMSGQHSGNSGKSFHDRELILVDVHTGEPILRDVWMYGLKYVEWSRCGNYLLTHGMNRTSAWDREGVEVWGHDWVNRGAWEATCDGLHTWVMRHGSLYRMRQGSSVEEQLDVVEPHPTQGGTIWEQHALVSSAAQGIYSMCQLRHVDELWLRDVVTNAPRVRLAAQPGWPQLVGAHVALCEDAPRVVWAITHVMAHEASYIGYDHARGEVVWRHDVELGHFDEPRSVFLEGGEAVAVTHGSGVEVLAFEST